LRAPPADDEAEERGEDDEDCRLAPSRCGECGGVMAVCALAAADDDDVCAADSSSGRREAMLAMAVCCVVVGSEEARGALGCARDDGGATAAAAAAAGAALAHEASPSASGTSSLRGTAPVCAAAGADGCVAGD
jgi:hypothetical protein